MKTNSKKAPRIENPPKQDQPKVQPPTGGLHAKPPTPGRKRWTQDKKPAAASTDSTVAEHTCPWPRQPMSLAVLMGELEDSQPTQDTLRDVADSLRMECELIKPDDRVLDFSVAHGRMYCAVLSESQSATHNSGCLRLIVVGIDLGDKAVWETVIRLPLSAPDCQGLFRLAGGAMDASIAPTVTWLARFHGLTQKGHERAMVGLVKATNPSMQ